MQLTGAQIIIECLKEQGTQTLFGYPGGTVLSVYDALYERGEGIRHILTTHEQGAAHAADGYARATGKTGVCLVTSGPGATNLVTGIATAYMDSSPVVAITINVPVASLGRDSFQEIDIAGITMPVTKHSFIVKEVTQLAACLRRAFNVARVGRPGPVLVDIARDVTDAVCEFEPDRNPNVFYLGVPSMNKYVNTDPSSIISAAAAAAASLIRSKRPVIIAGGGCVRNGAGEAIARFADRYRIPVVTTMMGTGAVPGSSRLFLGMGGEFGTQAAARAMKDSDLIVAAGCRFSDRLTGENGEFLGNGRIVHVDVDKAELNKNVRADIAIQSDSFFFFKALEDAMEKKAKGKNVSFEKWACSLKPEDQSGDAVPEDAALTGDLVARIAGEEAGSDAIYVTEVGECQVSAVNHISFERAGSLITSGGLGTMGFGLGAAIGAKAGCPERTVINLAGDGAFRMNMAEIMTAVSNDLPVIEIIFDNGVLGMVHTIQKEKYSGRFIATELDDTYNYAQVAKSMKAKAFDCSTAKELRAALREALKENKVSVIVCHIP